MPRVALHPSRTNPNNPLLISGPNTYPSVLKRNQACHQCRRRKLKWFCTRIFCVQTANNPISSDAKRPACSTCLRSHAYAVSHANAGIVLPLEPECTYGKIAEGSASASSTPSNSVSFNSSLS